MQSRTLNKCLVCQYLCTPPGPAAKQFSKLHREVLKLLKATEILNNIVLRNEEEHEEDSSIEY